MISGSIIQHDRPEAAQAKTDQRGQVKLVRHSGGRYQRLYLTICVQVLVEGRAVIEIILEQLIQLLITPGPKISAEFIQGHTAAARSGKSSTKIQSGFQRRVIQSLPVAAYHLTQHTITELHFHWTLRKVTSCGGDRHERDAEQKYQCQDKRIRPPKIFHIIHSIHWLREPELNQHLQVQSLMCCRYTIPR